MALDVFVDFTSDFHNGMTTGGDGAATPNGIADWIDELNQGTLIAGAPLFSASERAQIESTIISELERVYAGTTLNFVLEEPAGDHEVIYMGRDNDDPGVGSSNLGSAPVDFANQDVDGYSDRDSDPSGVARVTPSNIVDSGIESNEPRAQQIQEISISIAGTAAHELAHTFGLHHQYTYTNPNITPANYNNTNDFQNLHILATGDTDISESQRETPRVLSPFSRVVIDLSGGSQTFFSNDENISIVPDGGIQSDRAENGPPGFGNTGTDAGDTIAGAQPLTFETGEFSGQEISFVEADLDFSPSDVDVFSFSTTAPATLNSLAVSEDLRFSSNEFDPVLELLDESGAVLFMTDDLSFDGNDFVDPISPEDTADDPLLVNLPLAPGDYYLRVSPATVDVSDSPNVGDIYYLVTSLVLDESALLSGDYNGDGVVNAADYTVYRDTLGAEVDLAFNGADGDGDGEIGPGDYEVWNDSLGATSAHSLTVPEPSAIATVALGCWLATFSRRRLG